MLTSFGRRSEPSPRRAKAWRSRDGGWERLLRRLRASRRPSTRAMRLDDPFARTHARRLHAIRLRGQSHPLPPPPLSLPPPAGHTTPTETIASSSGLFPEENIATSGDPSVDPLPTPFYAIYYPRMSPVARRAELWSPDVGGTFSKKVYG